MLITALSHFGYLFLSSMHFVEGWWVVLTGSSVPGVTEMITFVNAESPCPFISAAFTSRVYSGYFCWDIQVDMLIYFK